MSNKERWLSSTALLISILPFIMIAIAMQMLPGKSIDDYTHAVMGMEHTLFWNDKYKFLYSGIIGLVPIVLIVLARVLKRRKLVERNFMYMIAAALILGVLFLLVDIYGVIYSIIHLRFDIFGRLEFFGAAAIAASLVVGMLANFLPILRRNDAIGIKNKYTLSDNRVWIKVHYVAADVYMITMFLFAMFSSILGIGLGFNYGWVHIVLWVVTVSGLLIWGRLYSRKVSLRLNKSQAEKSE